MRSLEDLFFNLHMRLLPELESWRRIGVNIDVRRALLHRTFIGTRIERSRKMIEEIVGPTYNPNSSKQTQELLYSKWKLPTQYNEERIDGKVIKKVTVDGEARKRLRNWIGALAEHKRGEYEQASTFLNLQDYLQGEEAKIEFLDRISPDFRVHAYFKAHGTVFFRLSSKPNLQNWPSYDVADFGGARSDNRSIDDPTGLVKPRELGSLRSIVIPDDPAKDLIESCDYEQIELWVYAQHTQCKYLLDAYHRGEYVYGRIYEDCFKQPFFKPTGPRSKENKLDSISEKLLRRAKAIPLGFLYGRSAAAVALEHGWPREEGEVHRRWFFDHCPELLDSYQRDRYQMEQKGYIRYPCGHIIYFPSGKATDVYSCRGQHPAACILLEGILRLSDALRAAGLDKEGVRIMLSVHDSLSFNIPERHLQEVHEGIIAPTLSRPIEALSGFSFRHSTELGKRWDWETTPYEQYKVAHQVQNVQ